MPDSGWDREVAYELFESEGGPVGDMLRMLGVEVATRARALCPRDSGVTADSIHIQLGQDSQGLFVEIGGSYVLRFLEHPAKQMHRAQHPLTDALRSLAGRRE